jgi:salivary acidic proline-rich phosphoprotein 1/2
MTQAPWQQGAPPQGWQQGPPQGPPPNQGWQPAPPQQGPPPQAGPPAQGQGQPWQQTPQAPPAPQPSSANEDGDDEFFTSSTGGKYMSFGDDSCIGYERGGEIVGLGERQQTDQKTKQPMFWPNSDRPIMIKVVTLQTNERMPNDPEDTGMRSIWLPQSKDVTKAVTEAMRVANTGEIRLRIGGQLWVTRTGSRQTTQQNGQKGMPAFTYTARYVPPPAGSRNDSFFAGPPQQTNGAPQQGPPAQTAPPQQSQTPWQQGPPPQQGNPYQTAQAPAAQGQGWQQGPPPAQGLPNGQAPWAQQAPPAAQGWQQGPPQQAGPPPTSQAPWTQPQQGPPQGPPTAANGQAQQGYQPSAPDPANPWGNQQGAPPQGWQPQQ